MYEVCIESSFSHTLTGKRVPRKETRKTLASAEKRARHWLAALGFHAESIGRDYLHRSDVLMLDAGPTAGAFIHRIE